MRNMLSPSFCNGHYLDCPPKIKREKVLALMDEQSEETSFLLELQG